MTQKLTVEQAIIVSGYTGVLVCDLDTYLDDVEKRIGHPVQTNQLFTLRKEISEAYREDFIALKPS